MIKGHFTFYIERLNLVVGQVDLSKKVSRERERETLLTGGEYFLQFLY